MSHTLSITRDIPFADLGLCLFRCWTEPDLLKPWFCPKPWKTTHAEIDLRPGGKFHTVMQGPDGETHGNRGCFLEIVEGEKIVWTSAMSEGWHPIESSGDGCDFPMVATVTFEDLDNGILRYTAQAEHWTAEAKAKHEAMGFEQGWNICLDQLIAFSKSHKQHS